MMEGLVEFVYRLLNPIEEKYPRLYRFDVSYGQLIGMLVLLLICYQFTIVGESVYIDAIRAFVRNSALFMKWQALSPSINYFDGQSFFVQLGKPRDFWNLQHFVWVLLKGSLMCGIIFLYGMVQQRKLYVRTVFTGVFHIMAISQLVIAIFTLTAGIMLTLTSLPLILQSIIGFCLLALCVLSATLLLQIMGRIIGSCISGSPSEGLAVMLIAILISLIVEILHVIL